MPVRHRCVCIAFGFQVFFGPRGVLSRIGALKQRVPLLLIIARGSLEFSFITELPKLGRFDASDSVPASPSPGAAPETGAPGPQGKAEGIRKESRACPGFAGVFSPAWSALVPPTQWVGGHRVVRAFTWGGQSTGYQPKGPFPCKAWKGHLLA